MNYSTLKKTVALSFASLMAVGIASAQTDSTKTVTTTSSETTTAKVFGGLGQYRKFSIGINGGATSPNLATAGRVSDYGDWKISYGYGLYLKEQLAHSFAIQLDLNGGRVEGGKTSDNVTGHFKTEFYQASLSAVVNVATIDFIRRKNSVNFFFKAGGGITYYNPTGVLPGAAQTPINYTNSDGSKHYAKDFVLPVGVGAKFRLSDAVALDLGYTENFVDADNFDGYNKAYPTKDRYSYAYAGLEFTLGSKSKPVLQWVNPVAMMYDELYDAALRQEVEALKGRVTNVETAVNDLKKDSDGDGVADQFDKCPGTAAGSVVDGSGCVIVFPKPDTTVKAVGTAYSNIQFEFDSSVLRTSSYPVLDATSADLRASGKGVEVDGYASSEGTAAHNIALSKDRANSVKTYLVNSGVDAKKVKVKGFGETNPIADNSTEDGRVLNRRVQFKQK
jgi:OOP family OmpA-OmpF porin